MVICDGGKGFCMYPHGRYTILALHLSVIALGLHNGVLWGCSYVVLDVADNNNLLTMGGEPVPPSTTLGVGLVSYQDFNHPPPNQNDNDNDVDGESVCLPYDVLNDDFLMGAFSAARGFAIMTNAFIGITILVLLASACVAFTGPAMKFVAILLFMAGTMELLTFVLYSSQLCQQNVCHFSYGSSLALCTAAICFIASVVVSQLPPAPGLDDSLFQHHGTTTDMVPGTVHVTEMTLPNGCTRIIKTIVNYDGSQTVEETLIQHPIFVPLETPLQGSNAATEL